MEKDIDRPKTRSASRYRSPGPLRLFSFILSGGFSRFSSSFVGRPHNTTRGVARMSFSSLPQLPSPTPSCSTHQRKKPSQRSSCSGDEVNHHLGRKLFSPPPPPDQKKTKTHSRPVLTAKKSACICRRRKFKYDKFSPTHASPWV